MAWTPEDRRRYAPVIQEVVRQGMLVRLAATIDAIDPLASVGRPRVWPTPVMLQALWHVARDDRAWRWLPPTSPPHQTVWNRLRGWRRLAVLDRALQVLVACHRLAVGRKRRPTTAIIDTQGDPLGVQVVAADLQDRDALRALGPDLDAHASLLLIWLDRGFAGDDPAIFLRGYGISAELVETVGRKGFQAEPWRWKVEQTFACLQRYRRLRVDDESHHATSRHMTVLASVFMVGMRLQRASQS